MEVIEKPPTTETPGMKKSTLSNRKLEQLHTDPYTVPVIISMRDKYQNKTTILHTSSETAKDACGKVVLVFAVCCQYSSYNSKGVQCRAL